MNGKTNGVHSEGMVHSLLDDEHGESWKPEIPFENVRFFITSSIPKKKSHKGPFK